ncbi:unnamed protein product [Caenorhabditis auriculariae]|uniref:Chromatin target of PRMT1 protein C-terminal domain-containing protein n=1 Tax=Caenorhabditis auriculariae TaxID=2777116 RepID=A0A8S1GRY3_9PELO|nr:unnamed protein product [Caenorhabditis auriculariae]
MSVDCPVPAKVVIVGTSTISLNERFSTLPAPKRQVAALQGSIQRPTYSRQIRRPREDYNFEEFVEEYDPAEPPVSYRRPIRIPRQPLQSRLSYVPQVIYVPQQQLYRGRNPRFRGTSAFSSRGSHNHQRRFNNYRGNSLPRTFRGTSFKRGTQRGNSYQNNGNFQNNQYKAQSKKSVQELDRELDEYMRKPKHTPITI